MQPKEYLTLTKKGNQMVQEYLDTAKTITDEISLIDLSILDNKLMLCILNGLWSDFCKIATLIWARERPLSFEKLHDLLVGHDAYLWHLEAAFQQLIATTNYLNCKSESCSSLRGYQYKNFSKSQGVGL